MQTILNMLALALVAALVYSIFKKYRINKTKDAIGETAEMQEIEKVIFANGQHPSRIAVTLASEIFYGPIDGTFRQVPSELMPVGMSHTELMAIVRVLETKHCYKAHLCNNGLKSGEGSQQGDTGDAYIDQNVHMLLVGTGATGNKW